MNRPPDVDQLLASTSPADPRIIEAVVAGYRASLFRLSYAMLGDPDETEDAVQQTFFQAALNLERYQPGSNFKAWLVTIAINACRGLLRKRKARQALAALFGSSQKGSPGGEKPEDAAVEHEADRLLWSAVGRLEERYRLVIILRFEQGLTIPEIASSLSIPEKTVYSRLYTAFRLLRPLLAAQPDYSPHPWLDSPEVAP